MATFLDSTGLQRVWNKIKSNFVKDVSISGNNLRVNKNGANTDLTIPYATNAGKVNNHTVDKDVPSNALFTDNNTTYTLSVDGTNIKLTPSSGSANTITVPFATTAQEATDNIPKIQSINKAIATFNGNGTYNYCKVATIVIKKNNDYYPITFELNGRDLGLCHLEVKFNAVSNIDPSLEYFRVDADLPDTRNFGIKRTDTSTWEIYQRYDGAWNVLSLLRVTTNNVSNHSVTVNMTGLSSMPSGVTYATNMSVEKVKSELVPDYANQVAGHYGQFSSADDVRFTDTITYDRYIQLRINTNSVSSAPFMRLTINDKIVYEVNKTGAYNYKYVWSPLFRVKTGDVVVSQLGIGAEGGNYWVYSYPLR